jgi:PilZ domain
VDRLRDHEAVVITLPQGQYLSPTSFGARMLAYEERTIALEVENPVDAVRVPDRVPNSFLTFRHGDSLVGFRGTLFAVPPAGDFRFVVADQTAMQGRATRVKCAARIAIRHACGDDGAHTEAEGTTVNIAPGGMLIDAPQARVATGDVVEFTLWHPDRAQQVVGVATVVRQGGGMLAVALSADSTEAHAALGALVVAHSRAELHRDSPSQADAPAF